MRGPAQSADQPTQGQFRWSIPLPHKVPNSSFVSALARSILAGELSADQIVGRCSQLTGRRWRWLRPLAHRFLKTFGSHSRPRHREVVMFLTGDDHFQDALHRPAMQNLRLLSKVLLPGPHQSFSKKASLSTSVKRASCAKVCASTSQDWSLTNVSMLCAQTLIY